MWNSKRHGDLATSTEAWSDTETVAEAFARFSTFGPVMGAAEALAALKKNPALDVMSFGYGDDTEDFDSVGLEELAEAIAEDGVDVTDDVWGPFAVWL